MQEPILKVENVSKKYVLKVSGTLGVRKNQKLIGEVLTGIFDRSKRAQRSTASIFYALQDIHFEANPGEVIGIIGRNGAGKSTLLKIISRVTEPTKGRVIINGRYGSLLEVGTGFHSELTGRENIFISGSIIGMSQKEIRSKFDSIVDFSGVEKFLDLPVKRYSSGMEVRLAFAVASHLAPDLLLVDEVLSIGDASFQQKSLAKIKEVAENGGAVLFISHNMNSIQELCNSVMTLDQGQIIYPKGDVAHGIKAHQDLLLQGKHNELAIHGSDGGPVQIQGFYLADQFGNPVEFLTTGSPIELRLSYLMKDPGSLKNAFCNFYLHSGYGTLLAVMRSDMPLSEGKEAVGMIKNITCKIGNIPLAPGPVRISAFIEQNGMVIEQAVNCFDGMVDDGGRRKGMYSNTNGGLLMLDETWTVE